MSHTPYTCSGCGERTSDPRHDEHCIGKPNEAIADLQRRLAALESAPRLAIVYEAERARLDGYGAPERESLGVFWSQDKAEAALGEDAAKPHTGMPWHRAGQSHLVVVMGGEVRVVEMGRVLEMRREAGR